MKKYLTILRSNYLYIYTIALLVLILSLHYNYVFLLLVIYLFKLKNKYNKKIMIFSIIFVSIIFIYQKNKYIPKKITGKFSVVKVEEYEYNKQIVIKNNKYKFILYTNEDLKIGSIIEVEGNVKDFKDVRIPFGFNQKNYYFSNGIYGEVINYKINLTNNYNYIYYLKDQVNNYLKQNNQNDYIRELLGYKSINNELRNNFKAINVIHLFSLSGINIYLILSILKNILGKFNIEKDKVEIVEIIILLLFLLIANSKFAIYRIFMYYLLKYLAKRFNIKITKFSLQQISFLFIICLYPFYMFNSSVLLSYLLVSAIFLLNEYFKNDNILVKNIKLTLIYTIVTIPFYGSVNITYLIFGSLITLFIIYGLYPVILFNLIFPKLSFITNRIISILEEVISFSFMKEINYNFGKMSIYIALLYFIIFIIFLKYNKKIIIATLITILSLSPFIVRKYGEPKLYFLDVGQGDTAVYLGNDEVIVIDSFSGTKNFLISMGINKIDYLIISHSDLDHMSEAIEIINYFKVERIILSKYDNYNINEKNIIKLNGYLTIKTKEVLLEFFGPLEKYSKTNNNSLVFKLNIKDTSILFSGDIEKEAESELVETYKLKLKSDILKAPHHGSITSSSNDFLEYVNPSDVVISLDRDNKFGFPNDEVIERYLKKGIKIHRTDLCKTILYHKRIFTYPLLSL